MIKKNLDRKKTPQNIVSAKEEEKLWDGRAEWTILERQFK